MKYSPKLKKAMEQIKVILKENDIAGHVVLHTPGFSEYLNHLFPSYSAIKIEPSGNYRIRAKAEDFDGDKDKRNLQLGNTANMLHHLSEITGRDALVLIELSETIDKITNAEHNGSGHSSNQEQNN